MRKEFHVVVCSSIVPDPLQTLEPVLNEGTPGLKNEMMLPNILDPWAAHALYEAANFAKKNSNTKVWLISIGPKAKLQQVLMTISQKVPFQFKAVESSASGFTESSEVAKILYETINGIDDIDKNKMILFGGWQSASRGAGTTMSILGQMFGISNQFQGVDELSINEDDSFKILERVEGGKHQVSVCKSLPMLIGWATGNLSEPPNNPQIGMMNMKFVIPAIQKALRCDLKYESLNFKKIEVAQNKRETKIIKNKTNDEIAKEIVEWIEK